MMSFDSDTLDKIALFHDLPPAQLSVLNGYLRRKTFPVRTNILTIEQPGEAVYFLLHGTAKICVERLDGTDVILDICGPGEVLGEISVVDGLGHSASATTLETSEVFWMDRCAFCECLDAMPIMARNLTCLMARRLRRLSAHAYSLATMDVPGRVACHLLSFAREYGETGTNDDILIPIPLAQGDLAGLIGASRESVNKVLAFYKRQRFISIGRNHRIIIHNQAALQKCCR